jgi:hypothetical protein
MNTADVRERWVVAGHRAVIEAVAAGRLPAAVPADARERVAAIWSAARRRRDCDVNGKSAAAEATNLRGSVTGSCGARHAEP